MSAARGDGLLFRPAVVVVVRDREVFIVRVELLRLATFREFLAKGKLLDVRQDSVVGSLAEGRKSRSNAK
jgi:hypothetical protein